MDLKDLKPETKRHLKHLAAIAEGKVKDADGKQPTKHDKQIAGGLLMAVYTYLVNDLDRTEDELVARSKDLLGERWAEPEQKGRPA